VENRGSRASDRVGFRSIESPPLLCEYDQVPEVASSALKFVGWDACEAGAMTEPIQTRANRQGIVLGWNTVEIDYSFVAWRLPQECIDHLGLARWID
jgi:hypothetical protein